MTADTFAVKVMAYCNGFQASVTSWGRTVKRNLAVGGVARSPHLLWLGCDVVYDHPQELEACEEFARSIGLRVIREKDHDHLQPLDWKAS